MAPIGVPHAQTRQPAQRSRVRAERDDAAVSGGRRIGELSELRSEIAAWAERVNERQRGVDWQLQIDKARNKLSRLYPHIETG